MPSQQGFPEGRGALIVAHPGHELLLHGWMEIARPLVSILSDGSGGAAAPRIDSSRALLARLGCRLTDVSGRMTDRRLYRAIMECDTALIAALTLDLADQILDDGVDYVVADAMEGYNPVHDLCRVIADLVAEKVRTVSGRPIGNYEYGVVDRLAAEGPDDVTIALDDGALQRKLEAAWRYEEMRNEVNLALDRFGDAAMRMEILKWRHPDAESGRPARPPFYETYGRTQVEAGRYDYVLTYSQHFAPLADALGRAVRSQPALA